MGGPNIDLRSFKSEWPQIKAGYKGQEQQLNQFVRRDPILSKAYPFAQESLAQVPQLTDPLMALFKRGTPELTDMLGSLSGVYKTQIAPILQSGGALTPQLAREATQNTLSQFAGRGNVFSQAEAAAFLNRDAARQARFKDYLNSALGVSGEERALTGAQTQIPTQLANAVQGVRGNALSQALGTERAGVQSFSQLTNPILSYMQDLFSSNQNAAATGEIANANKN